MDLLLVVDLQKAFINVNTRHLIKKINNLINCNTFSKVVFTKFVNNDDSIWVKKLNYKGCISPESKRIVVNTSKGITIDKRTYSALTKQLKKYIRMNNINKIYLCGIDTECCVLKTALDLFEKGYDVYVLKDYCACTHGLSRHNRALDILKRDIGEEFII